MLVVISVLFHLFMLEKNIMVIVFVDLKTRLYHCRKANTVVYKTKKPAKIMDPQNCVQMPLSCIATNLVMEPALYTGRFNVQAILIIAWMIILTKTLCLPVMASSDVKHSALAPLKSSHMVLANMVMVMWIVGAAIVGKGMVPNSTTSNAQFLITIDLFMFGSKKNLATLV